MKSFFLNVVFISCAILVSAQNKLSLKQAIETGITNNLTVNQSDLAMQKADIAMKQSKANMLPTLNGSANYGANQGRSIDPFTNAFINQDVSYSAYGANSTVLLFQGSSLHNQIKSNELGYQASKMELQQAKDNLTINIILAYLQILSAEDILKSSLEQKAVTDSQVNRLAILNQSGDIAPKQYFDLKGQLANEEISIVNNQAALETAKLTLAQLLNIPYDKNLEVERLPEESFNILYDDTPDKIYQTALQQFAQIKSVRLRTQSAQKNIRAIQGQLYPSLSLGGYLSTNYSSVATQSFFVNSTEVSSSDYVVVNGTQAPVMTTQDNYDTKKITYGNQLSNNLYTTVNLGLTVPLFNGWQVKNKIKLAKIDLKNTELVEQNTKIVLQQSIEQAYVNLTSSSNKYKLLLDQVNSFTESFREAAIIFKAGNSTSDDYLIAKNNMDAAMINLIIEKYDFVLRTKILDYYQGKASW